MASPCSLFARLLADHLPDHLPGQTGPLRVENWEGSEGMDAIVILADEDTPRDGSTIASVHERWMQRELIGEGAEEFDPAEQTIGSIRRLETPRILWARQDVCTDWDECMEGDPLLIGDADAGGGTDSGPSMTVIAGANTEVVFGYEGTADLFAGFERGEIDAIGADPPALPEEMGHLCEEEEVYPIAKWGPGDALVEQADDCWDALGISEEPPLLDDLADFTEAQSLALNLVAETAMLVRGSYFVPPDTPEDIRQWWSARLEETVTSDDFIDDAVESGYSLDSFGHSPPEVMEEAMEEFREAEEQTPEIVDMLLMLQGFEDPAPIE
jgi:hypothetical protein